MVSASRDPQTTVEPVDFREDPRTVVTSTGSEQTYLAVDGLSPSEAGVDESAREVRWYAVWSIPGHSGAIIAGIHWGQGVDAYANILHLNGGQFGGIKWRRGNSKEDAQAIFEREAHRFRVATNLSQRLVGWVHGA